MREEAGHTLVVGALKSEVSIGAYAEYDGLLARWGLIADWWSFPFVRAELVEAMKAWPYVYAYYDKKLLFRLHVLDCKTQPGSQGVKTPWPRVTKEPYLDKRRGEFDGTSFIFKTWFLVDECKPLTPPLSTEELEGADGRPISFSSLRGSFALWRVKGT